MKLEKCKSVLSHILGVARGPSQDAAAVPLSDQTSGHHTNADSFEDLKEAMAGFACWQVKVRPTLAAARSVRSILSPKDVQG